MAELEDLEARVAVLERQVKSLTTIDHRHHLMPETRCPLCDGDVKERIEKEDGRR